MEIKIKEETMKTQVFMSIIVCLCIVFLSTSVQGVVIPLSTHSSEPATVPASLLDASLELSVERVGLGDDAYWQLSVAVENLTPQHTGDPGFNISQIYFNTTADITALTLLDVVGGNPGDWALTLDMDNIEIAGFGLFDIGIQSYAPASERIPPQGEVTFLIMIAAGTPPYSDTDFYDLTAQPGGAGQFPAYAAAKFFNDDMSAYGANAIPEPTTIFLLGLGALALLRKRRI